MRKAGLPIHNTKRDCIPKTGSYLQPPSFPSLAVRNLYDGKEHSQSCNPLTAAFCSRDMVSSGRAPEGKTRVAPKTSKFTTAWWLASNSINMPLVTKCHINKKKRRASHTQQKAGLHSENWPLPTASQLHMFARRNLFSPCFCNFNSGTRVSGKTRMVPKTSKLTTACRLPSNSKNMPLTMKCQINTEKSQFFRNTPQNWITSGKLAAPYDLAASLFCTVLDPASW